MRTSFTPIELYTALISVCGAIITVSGALVVISQLVSKIRKPEHEQNERLEKCEKRLDQHDEKLTKYMTYFESDGLRLRKIEESNRITQRSMLALLKHSINGEDLESLRKAEKDLEEYLINKAD